MAVQGWRTRVYVDDFLVMSCPTFVGSLLLHLMIVWFSLVKSVSLELLMDNLQEFGMFKYLLWPKFSQIFQKCSAKNKVSNHPIIVCYSSPASPLGVPSQAPSRLIRCLFEDCDGKKHFGTDVSSMTKGYKRLSWMCTPVSIWLKITLGIFHRHVPGYTKN